MEGTPVTPLALCTPTLQNQPYNPIDSENTVIFPDCLAFRVTHHLWILHEKINYYLSHCLGRLLIPDSNTHTK